MSDPSTEMHWDGLEQLGANSYRIFSGSYPPGFLIRPASLHLDNWFHEGNLRAYAMLHLPEVVRCRELERGNGPVYMFGRAEVPELFEQKSILFPDESFPQRNIPLSVREVCSWTNVQGIVVVRYGHLIAEMYPGMDPAQRHHWMSISKSAIKDWRYRNHCYARGCGMTHQGHSGQTLWVNPDTGTVVACFATVQHPCGQDPWTARLQLFMAEAIDRELNGNSEPRTQNSNL